MVKRVLEEHISVGPVHRPKVGFGMAVEVWGRLPIWKKDIDQVEAVWHKANASSVRAV